MQARTLECALAYTHAVACEAYALAAVHKDNFDRLLSRERVVRTAQGCSVRDVERLKLLWSKVTGERYVG